MSHSFVWRRAALLFSVTVAAFLFLVEPSRLLAQRGGGAPAAPPPTAQASSPIDLTGYWEAIVTEDWRWRMITPPKGDYQSVTLNDAARKVADTWDPDKDTAAGLQCKAYGAPAIMRIPGRIHVTWKDASTLQIDTEAGTQTRLLHFDTAGVPYSQGAGVPFTARLIPETAPAGDQGWQGYSVAGWLQPRVPTAPGGRGRGGNATTMKVVTTQMRPGYLRRNGVPYSANAVVTEYFNVLDGPDGAKWLLVANFVEDPQYLDQPFATSTHFKKLNDGSAWKPEPCTAKQTPF